MECEQRFWSLPMHMQYALRESATPGNGSAATLLVAVLLLLRSSIREELQLRLEALLPRRQMKKSTALPLASPALVAP